MVAQRALAIVGGEPVSGLIFARMMQEDAPCSSAWTYTSPGLRYLHE